MVTTYGVSLLLLVLTGINVAAGVDGGWKFEGWYPNHYVAQQLGPSESITIDGKLVRGSPCRCFSAAEVCAATSALSRYPHVACLSQDEAEWLAIPSLSEGFVDITHHENEQLNAVPPNLQAKVKVRWDERFVYVGAELQEPWIHAAATQTHHNGPVPPYLGVSARASATILCVYIVDSKLCNTFSHPMCGWADNDFEIFLDPSGSTQYYLEFEMNALNATYDIKWVRPQQSTTLFVVASRLFDAIDITCSGSCIANGTPCRVYRMAPTSDLPLHALNVVAVESDLSRIGPYFQRQSTHLFQATRETGQ